MFPNRSRSPACRAACAMILVLVAAWGCEGGPPSASGGGPGDPSYATTLRVLAPWELGELLAAYRERNPDFCSGLDPYGFTGDTCDACVAQGGIIDPEQTPALVAAVREALARNAEFTGVRDAGALEITQTTLAPSGRWLDVTFARQRVAGEEVPGTRITIRSDAEGPRCILGRHYPVVSFPESPALSLDEARRSLVGLEIEWAGFDGTRRLLTVREGDLGAGSVRLVRPVEYPDRIELLVAWRIGVELSPGETGWYVYVDSMTGESLGTEQLFAT